MILEKIKALCKERRISLHKLEIECGIGNGVVAKWGKSFPRVDMLQRVAAYFGKTLDYFMEE